MEDDRIIDLYLARDELAILSTGEKYGRRLRALAYRITGDAAAAEECENDTYLRCWHTIPPQEPREHFYAFLAQITRRLAINRCRDRDRQKRSAQLCELTAELEQCIPDPNGGDSVEDIVFAGAVNGFLGDLPEWQRNLFLRRYWFADSIADLSERFGISRSKVKTTLFRLRGQLRCRLEQEGWR